MKHIFIHNKHTCAHTHKHTYRERRGGTHTLALTKPNHVCKPTSALVTIMILYK